MRYSQAGKQPLASGLWKRIGGYAAHIARRVGLVAALLLMVAPAATAGKSSLQSDFEVPHDAALNPVNKITLEAWIRYNFWEPGEACETVIGKNPDTSFWFGICDGHLTFLTRGQYTRVQSDGVIPTQQWSHVAVTFDGLWHRFYINGVLDSSVKKAGSIGFNLDPVSIGADRQSMFCQPYSCSAGYLSEVRLWNTVRSQAQIRKYIYRYIDTPMRGLVAAWPLDLSIEDVIGGRAGDPVGPWWNDDPRSWRTGYSKTGAPPVALGTYEIPSRRQHRYGLDGTSYSNGHCSWHHAYPTKVMLWQGNEAAAATAYMGTERDYVYVCIEGLGKLDRAIVAIDPTGNGGAYAGQGDFRAVLSRFSGLKVQTGNGLGGFINILGTLGIEGHFKRRQATWFAPAVWQAQLRIPRSRLAQGPDGKFGIQVMVDTDGSSSTSGDYGWPEDSTWNRPASYQTVTLDDTSPDLFYPAYHNGPGYPVVSVDSAGRHVLNVATSEFDRDEFSEGLRWIIVYYDGAWLTSCWWSQESATFRAECSKTYENLLTLGAHELRVSIEDFAGNRTRVAVPFAFLPGGRFEFMDTYRW